MLYSEQDWQEGTEGLACFVVFYSEQDRQEDGTAGSLATDWGVPPKANQAKK